MDRRKIGVKCFTSRALRTALLSALICLLVLSPVKAVERDLALEQSGIHYPYGFDVNTVGDVRGMFVKTYRQEGASNLVTFDLETTWERYTVIACPPWFWDKLKINALVGEEVRVIGSKSLGKDSNLYIIAQEIRFIGQEKTVVLRSKNGNPIWDTDRDKTDGSGGGARKRIRGQ